MMMFKKCFFVLVLFLLTSFIGFGQEWKVKEGEEVPKFSLLTKEGTKVSSDDLRGKVVLLNFFATWCPPCRQELPRLQSEIWEELGDKDDFTVCVLAREEGWDKLDPFMSNHKYTFPVFPDLNREVFSLFAEQSIPRNVVLDKEGKIIYQSIGYESEEFTNMIALIKAQLKK